jgi:hypothetical protein
MLLVYSGKKLLIRLIPLERRRGRPKGPTAGGLVKHPLPILARADLGNGILQLLVRSLQASGSGSGV